MLALKTPYKSTVKEISIERTSFIYAKHSSSFEDTSEGPPRIKPRSKVAGGEGRGGAAGAPGPAHQPSVVSSTKMRWNRHAGTWGRSTPLRQARENALQVVLFAFHSRICETWYEYVYLQVESRLRESFESLLWGAL